MKSLLSKTRRIVEQHRDDSDDEEDLASPTPTGSGPDSRSVAPITQDVISGARPPFARSHVQQRSEAQKHGESADTAEGTDECSDASDSARDAAHLGNISRSDSSNPIKPRGHPSGGSANVRDALNAKTNAETRSRRSYGAVSVRGEVKRVSPITEEDASSAGNSMDTILDNAQESLRTSSTVSTESTGSQRTIKGSLPPTPSVLPLRTPSYPFPYVPGTPRPWSSGVHQPFTALSPTVSAQPRNGATSTRTSSFKTMSGSSTPAGHTPFLPPGGGGEDVPEDPRYPTPNLYDLVLQLNSEPGLEQWWATVTNILHDNFKSERATLVMPVDPTDLENMPWGQKSTFSMNGPQDYVAPAARLDHAQSIKPEFVFREPSSEAPAEVRPQKLHPERLRPRLEQRHSYSGHGREVREILGGLNDPSAMAHLSRPAGPQRTATHAGGMSTNTGQARNMPPSRQPSSASLHQSSYNDPDFSSSGGTSETSPYARVFGTLRSLEQEVRPLIESAGVNRVLERSSVVAVTRDYVAESACTPSLSKSAPSGPKEYPGRSFDLYRSDPATKNLLDHPRDYNEYEQQPASPWAQSPAPSPAIQADEETNPFFAPDDQQLEDAFNPAVSPKDYSQFAQVEAIGVDHASTVIHIPLLHPTLSQPMPSFGTAVQRKEQLGEASKCNTVDMERKAPIAILSVLTATVPYPHNLIRALKLLGPHLATSFAIAQQLSASFTTRALNIRHRRTASGHHVASAPMTVEPASLEDIADADVEGPGSSVSETMTSPSEYSGRSRMSPSESIVGTPGWDPAAHGWTASRSVVGTPALTGSEMVDNYFDSKKRTTHRSGSNASSTTPAKFSKKSSSNGSSRSGGRPVDEDGSSPRTERRVKQSASAKDNVPQTSVPAGEQNAFHDITRPNPRPSISHLPDIRQVKQHSLLHSYGADFQHSFGSFPAYTSGDPHTPGVGAHSRKGSYPEDMPPPSERLLRTIIDSVPVQIFTAQPETGSLSWVNSKFLIYRGQEPKDVLLDPWRAIHPDDRNEFLPSWHRSLRTDQQLQQKVRLQRFDGSYRWFYVRAAPLKDKRMKVVHWIGTMMDFHEQQMAELNAARQQETAASEAKYRALANSSPQIVFAVDRVKGVTFCNTQWLHYSGQTEAHALGVGFMDHVHPDDLSKCSLPEFEGDSAIPTNVPTSLPPEPRRTVSTSATSSDDSSETERGCVSSPDSVSSPIPHMPQRKLSQLAATGILKVSRDADGRPSYSTEVRLKSKDGNYRWHLVRVLRAERSLLPDEDETWYGTCTDINDHKTLERDLKETMDEKSRFLSNMSHEIRTPLNGITGMVNFLIDSSLTAEQMEHVNIIRASTEGLRGLINDILDLSKAEAGMIQLSMDWLYVRALIEEVNDLTSAMAIDKGLELNYVVEEDVPPRIKGDRFRIRQILLNIVGNAIKFTQAGEVFVRCCLDVGHSDLEPSEAFVNFEIVDTGRGFTDKEAEFLFKRFSQIDGSSTRQHGGTGLGLVISRQLAQLHGGDMSAKGVPGKGSTFTISIKTLLPSKDDQPPPPPTPSGIHFGSLPDSQGSQTPVPLPAHSKTPWTVTPSDSYAKPWVKLSHEISSSPGSLVQSPDTGTESPSLSSGSSDPSVSSAARSSSLRSERSSQSSIAAELAANITMNLALPRDAKSSRDKTGDSSSASIPSDLYRPFVASVVPPMFSILVVAPLKHSREATVRHIRMTLPKNIPHQITARESFSDSQSLLGGQDPVQFTHVVAVLRDIDEIVALLDRVFHSPNSATTVVLITDLAQRRSVMEQAPSHDYARLIAIRRLIFVFKPLKPSRLGVIFDPQQERETSLDRNQDSAQQVAVNQKHIFEELTRRLGNRDKRVLLVEDNKVNQMVILKFLAKVSIKAETALDGVQCTEKVFANPHDYYSIILCDLHMPNKDGYQTCKEIRRWEKRNKVAGLPIIALSANVLGDVYQKCVDAGFNSYMTKPVDFKELSGLLVGFMDPVDTSRPHELMKVKRGQAAPSLVSMGR